MTKFISYYARRNNLLAVIFLVFGTSIFLIPTAQAAQANTSVICANPAGEQRSYQIGWDNSNQFFADKGYIPQFFCEGGYANPYRTYISDTLNGSALGYFNGVITPSSNPTPEPSPSESSTAEPAPSPSPTPSPSPSNTPEPQPSPSATADTSTSQSSGQETQTSQTETQTATPQPTETSTTPSDTTTIPAPVDGSTATSQPEPQPAPIPPAPPVLEPEVVTPPEPEVVPEPPSEPVPEVSEPVVEEPKAPVEEQEPEIIEEEKPEPEVEQTVTLDNGVVLTPEVAAAVVLLQDPIALVGELFTNPAAALAALGSVGSDMSPEVREKSEKVVISAVIAGNIATQAASAAGAAATYRRKQ